MGCQGWVGSCISRADLGSLAGRLRLVSRAAFCRAQHQGRRSGEHCCSQAPVSKRWCKGTRSLPRQQTMPGLVQAMMQEMG